MNVRESREFGTGIFSDITNGIYFFLMMNLYFIVGCIIPFVWLLLLEPSLSNLIPASFLGPSLTALCCCMIKYRERNKEKEDSLTFSDFRYYYKRNFLDTLKFWTPFCMLFFIFTFSFDYYLALNSKLTIILLILLSISTISITYMLIINAKFKFRTRDLLRLSLYYICCKIKLTLGVLSIFFLILVAMYFYSDFIILFLFSPLCYLLVHYLNPIIEDIQENFIQKEN